MTRAADRIVIAGGGIGGLAASLALAKRGFASVVCERRAAFLEDRAGIQIGPNGVKILRALGAADQLYSQTSSPDAISVRNAATAKDLTRLPLGQWIAERHGAPYWTAHRKDLHAALLDCAAREPLIEIRLGCEILSWSDTADGQQILADRNETFPARALIGAEGLWSRLRTQVCPSPPPKPVSKSAYRTVVQRSALPQALAANDVHIWLASGAHVVHYPVRSGREIALVLIVDDPQAVTKWNAEAAPDLSKVRAAPPLLKLLEAGDAWRKWSLYTAPPLPRWTSGRVALLGDAAHPVLPFLAQGAVLALEDGMALAQQIAAAPTDIEAALTRYADHRRPRATRVAAAAARNGRIYHFGGALALARNAVLSATPPARLMEGYDWVYGWRT